MRRHITPWLIALLALTTTSLYASGTITVPGGTSQQLHADHGFHAVSFPEGQQDVTLSAISDTIEGVPVCTDHDSTKWHPLVKKDAGGNIVCTYGHEHHDNPNSVNDIFGPPSAWYGGSQEISYPWQTASSAGPENNVKHEGYKWYVERDQPCRPAGSPPNDGCLIAWRAQVHSLGTAADAVVRFHSYSMELLVEYHGQRGIVRHGGHLDFGHLSLAASDGSVCPPLASDPATFRCGSDNHRQHSGTDMPAPHGDVNNGMTAWYSNHNLTSLSTTFEEWGPIDYQNPSSQLFFVPNPSQRLPANNSVGVLGNQFWNGSAGPLQQYVANGVMTFDGSTDRNGDLVTGCSVVGPDCVPLRVQGVTATQVYWNSGVQGDSVNYSDYDVVSPTTGKSLIRFPN